MNLKAIDFPLREPKINMNDIDDIYKCPSCDLPRSCISTSDSSKTFDSLTEFKTYSRKKKKKVKFNPNVTVVNIQSFKNNSKNNDYKNSSIFDEEFNKNKMRKQCANCLIF